MAAPRAFVTGATGFVGANLVRALLARGVRVRVFVRPGSRRVPLEGLDVEYTQGDVRDPASLEGPMRACDVVFHVAGDTRMFVPDPGEMWRTNVEGTRNVLVAAFKAGVPRVVHTSTVSAVAGSLEPGVTADEETPFNLDRFPFHYAITKRAAEDVCREAAAAGQDVVIVNPGSMFGSWDVRPNIGRMIVEVVRGKVPGFVRGGSSYVDVEDVCAGQILAWEKGRRGERYILTRENLTHQAVLERIASLVGARAPRTRIPYPFVWMGGLGGQWSGRMSGREPRLDLTLARASRYYFHFSHAKATRELGFAPRPIDDAIMRAYAWLRENRYLD